MKGEIKFLSDGVEGTEVLCLSKEGIWANPDVPVDKAAGYVLEALDSYVKKLVNEAVKAEREACALVAESYEPTCESCPSGVANAIRGRKAS